jgi:holdfast attachment protein HfaA
MAIAKPAVLRALSLLCCVAALGLGAAAAAQTMNANSASFNAGYNRRAAQENTPITASVRDANGNFVAVDGLIESGVDQSAFAAAGANSGAVDTVAGVGASSGSTVVGQVTVDVTVSTDNTDKRDNNHNYSGNTGDGSSPSGGVGNGN